jgi:sugar phosphate isomerase/epimerase
MMFFSNYERRVNDGLNYYRKYFKAMNILGAELLVFHGNKAVVPVDENLYFDRFFRLSEVGKEYNVSVAQENVARCQCNNIPFMVNMVRQLGNVAKFVIDLKQAIRIQRYR